MRKLFFHILKKDLKRKKTMNVILLLFVILATMFLASSINNLTAISGAVEHFLEISKAPDYFAIAMVNPKEDAIEEYLKNNQFVKEYEVTDSFALKDEQITITSGQESSKDGKYEQTSMLCLQAVPENFMKVFDMDNSSPDLKEGELAIGRIEAEANHLSVGDKVKIKIGVTEQEFTVASIMKDAVFGNSMIGLKRLIITQEDFKKFEEKQENPAFVRIYSLNYEDEETFYADWKKQSFHLFTAVDKETLQLCFVMDMLVAGVLVMVSICLILISFLVLRFTIVFTIQEDYKEIGIMKAIGIRDRGIKGIYLVKYLAISIVGASVGFILSFPFGDLLLKQTIVNIIVENADQNMIINLVCAIVIVGVIMGFCYGSTNKLKKFSVMDAIRSGSSGERYRVKNHLKLWQRKRMSPSVYMAVNDIWSSFKRYSILAVTFCIGTMLILLPLSAVDTLKSDKIVELFSFSPSDVYLKPTEVTQVVNQEQYDKLLDEMSRIESTLKAHGINASVGADMDYMVPCYSNDPEESVIYFTLQEIGSWDRQYSLLEGREPEAENELMITDITAKEMGAAIGDSIFYRYKDRTDEYIITGTYQSMMNTGKGFRVSRSAHMDLEYGYGIFCIQVDVPDMDSQETCEALKEIFPEHDVRMADEFIGTMIGGITEQIDTLMIFILGLVLIINSLITVLMMKTIMAKERGDIALLRSMGFSVSAVRYWQTARILLVLFAAIVLGALLSNLLAPFIIGPIFAMMGANQVKLVMDPVKAYVIYPLILLAVTGISAYICAGGVKKVDMKEVNTME